MAAETGFEPVQSESESIRSLNITHLCGFSGAKKCAPTHGNIQVIYKKVIFYPFHFEENLYQHECMCRL